MISNTFRRIPGFLILILSLWCGAGWGAQYDIKQMTPEVEQAIAGRQARYDALQARKAEGLIGENNRGYVAVRGPGAEVQGLVDSENRDRKVIYRTIVEQNNLGGNGLSVVESVFAEVQRDKARAGDHIQMPSGEWVKK